MNKFSAEKLVLEFVLKVLWFCKRENCNSRAIDISIEPARLHHEFEICIINLNLKCTLYILEIIVALYFFQFQLSFKFFVPCFEGIFDEYK